MSPLVESPPRLYSAAEYLALEENAEFKSEYRDGEIIPMTGGSLIHNLIIINLCTFLRVALKPSRSMVFANDVKVWIPDHNHYTYPDILVIPGKPELQAPRTDTVLNPALIIEVLSPSTAAYDRGDKFKAYRSLSSFQEYWLVDQYQMQIDQYCKTDDDTWLYRSYEDPQAIITSPTLGLDMAIAVAYEDVVFDQEHEQNA